jgi:hypothetical protein
MNIKLPHIVERNMFRFFLLLEKRRISISEVSNVGLLCSWGFGVFNPLTISFSQSPVYTALLTVLPNEIYWGAFVLFIGLYQFIGLYYNLMYTRRTASFISALLWQFIGILFWLGAPSSTAVYVYPVLSVTAALSYLELCLRKAKMEGDTWVNSPTG